MTCEITCEIVKTVTSVIPGVLPAVPIDLDAIRRIVREEIMHQEGEMHRLRTQRDALLEALKDMLNAEKTYPYSGMSESELAAIQKARAAIKNAEGGQ